MKRYYCPECAWQHGKVDNLPEGKLFNTPYQEVKLRKHTSVDSSINFQSVFTDPSTGIIREHTFNAVKSGSLFIDEKGRANLIFPVEEVVGSFYKYGLNIGKADAVIVVKHDNPERIHTFLGARSSYVERICDDCGLSFLIQRTLESDETR
jgi:hypothetical protein